MNKDFIKGAVTGYVAKSMTDSQREGKNDTESDFGSGDATADLILAGMIALAGLFGLVMFVWAWWDENFVVGIGVGVVCFFGGLLALYILLRFFGDAVKIFQYLYDAYQALRNWMGKR